MGRCRWLPPATVRPVVSAVPGFVVVSSAVATDMSSAVATAMSSAVATAMSSAVAAAVAPITEEVRRGIVVVVRIKPRHVEEGGNPIVLVFVVVTAIPFGSIALVLFRRR